jgi:copper chaperone CopZ
MAIKKELSRIKGIKEIEGDPKNKHIRVKWEAPATLEGIKETLIDINYPAA